MRIVRFTPGPDAGLGQDPLFGVLEDDATISIISGDPIYSGIQKTAAKIELNKVRLLAPIIPRSKVVCVGKNYADHAAEMGGVVPDEPIATFPKAKAPLELAEKFVCVTPIPMKLKPIALTADAASSTPEACN